MLALHALRLGGRISAYFARPAPEVALSVEITANAGYRVGRADGRRAARRAPRRRAARAHRDWEDAASDGTVRALMHDMAEAAAGRDRYDLG